MRNRNHHFRRGWRTRITILALLAAVIVLLGSSAALAQDRWTDISDQQWIDSYQVTAAQAATVAEGYPDGTFKPSLAVTRGQFAKMAVDGLDLETANPAIPTFSDVPTTHIFYIWIEGAVDAGVIAGFPDGTYRPATSISRQQANSILGLYLAQQELAARGHIAGDEGNYASLGAWYAAEGPEILAEFADGGSVASVHRPATAYLVFHNVVKGSLFGGSMLIRPTSDLTRAQAVALILRVKAVTFTTALPTVTNLNPNSGPPAGGNSVVITGTNFTGATAVKFGAVNATSFTVDSATQITAVAPAGTAGTVDVTITTPAGTSATSAASKYGYGVPTVTMLEPAIGPAVGGNSVVITGTGFTGLSGPAAVMFGAVNATSYVVDSPTQITAVAPAGTLGTTVDVTVTNSAGTSSTAGTGNDYMYEAFTADMTLSLTTPAENGTTNHLVISGSGAARTVAVDVVNTTASVLLTGGKTAAQTVTIGGTDAADVTAGGTATVPTYTVDTSDIAAAGGSKVFTLTVSETGMVSVVYTVTVTVAQPFTADMTLSLTTPAENGTTNHLVISGSGAARTVAVDVVNTTASVLLTGGKTAAQTVTIGGTDAADVTAGGTATVPTYTVDTSDIAAAGGSKVFTLTVSETGMVSVVYTVTVTVAQPFTADLTLSLTTPAENGTTNHLVISGSGAARTVAVDVVNTTASVLLTGGKTAAQTVTIGGTDAADVTAGGTATVPTYTVDTSDIAAAGGSKVFTLTVSETGMVSVVYTVTVTVAGP